MMTCDFILPGLRFRDRMRDNVKERCLEDDVKRNISMV